MTRVLVPPFAGVLSALGLAVASEQRVAVRAVMAPLVPALGERLAALAAESRRIAGGAGVPAWVARVRFAGQGHELEVPWSPAANGVELLATSFRERHQARYGFLLEAAIEVVSLRCTVVAAAPGITLARRGTTAWDPTAPFDDGSLCDAVVAGAAVIGLPDATLLVADGWRARALPLSGWLLER